MSKVIVELADDSVRVYSGAEVDVQNIKGMVVVRTKTGTTKYFPQYSIISVTVRPDNAKDEEE